MKSTYAFMKELVEKISNPRKRYVIITTNGQEGYTYGGKDFDINGELVFKEE